MNDTHLNTMKNTSSTLKLEIVRKVCFEQALHGQLRINGDVVCDTLENLLSCKEEGTYPLKRSQLKHIFSLSNGPYALRKGAIAIGEWHYLGFLIHTQEAYVNLMDRLRKSLSRGHQVELVIRECILPESHFQ